MANRDASTEKKAEEAAAPVADAPGRAFPTSQHITRARRAAGKIRPCNADSLKEFLDVAAELKKEAKG